MTVFSNTTPIIALSAIDRLGLLPVLFGKIHDEKLGRNLADYVGLNVTGTLGVLLKAKQQGLIGSFVESAEAMRRQGIYFSAALIQKLAGRVGE